MALLQDQMIVLRMVWAKAVRRSSIGFSAAIPRFPFRMATWCSRSPRRAPNSLRNRWETTERACGDGKPLISLRAGVVTHQGHLLSLLHILSRRNGSMKDRHLLLSQMELKVLFAKPSKLRETRMSSYALLVSFSSASTWGSWTKSISI